MSNIFTRARRAPARPVRAEPPRCLSRGGCGPQAVPGATPPSPPAGAAMPACGDVFGLWQLLIRHFLAQRPVTPLPDGSAVPETTVGDIVHATQLLSRELCQRQFDTALPVAARQTWATAERQIAEIARTTPWTDPFPDNPGFWYGSALALARQLSAVAQGRNAAPSMRDLMNAITDRPDAVEVWQDLRQFFLARRPRRKGSAGFAYPETTIADVVAIAKVFDDRLADVPLSAWGLSKERDAWAWARERVDDTASLARSQGDPYPHNEGFWLTSTKRLAIYVSAALDAMDGFDDGIAAQASRRHGRAP
jgi:hypothetical protein